MIFYYLSLDITPLDFSLLCLIHYILFETIFKPKIYPILFTKHLAKYRNQAAGPPLRYFADVW